jgi:hypothetical protein
VGRINAWVAGIASLFSSRPVGTEAPAASSRRIRPQRAADELRRYSAEHLAFALEALFVIGQRLRATHPRPLGRTVEDWADLMARIGAFGILLRLLVDFFYPRQPRHDDVLAEEFFAPPMAWKRIRGKLPRALGRGRDRANKELAHLTTGWISGRPDEKVWEVEPLLADMLALARRFANGADAKCLDQSVISLVDRLERGPLDLKSPLLEATLSRQVVAQTRSFTDAITYFIPDEPQKDRQSERPPDC